MVPMEQGMNRFLETLLELGANANLQDISGKMALGCICAMKKQKCN